MVESLFRGEEAGGITKSSMLGTAMAGINSRLGERKTHNPPADDRKRYAISTLDENDRSRFLNIAVAKQKIVFSRKGEGRIPS